jgi:signal transduction histidine kinase
VSRLQLGRVELHQRELDLVHSVREVVERMKLLHASHAFELKTDTQKAIVLADQDRIDQVFENLLGNAVKYSPAGGAVSVTIAIDGSEAQVSISDEGIGISADELENVFNIFYRSPDPRAGHVGGLGLGLYISREIVNRHGGRLWAESGPKGSTFYVAMPLVTSAKPEAVTSPATASRG